MIDLRAEFENWLKTENKFKRHSPNKCIACLVEVSQYALAHNLSKIEFFSISEPKEFKNLAKSILNTKPFRVFYSKRTIFSDFVDISWLYINFLKHRAKKPLETNKKTGEQNHSPAESLIVNNEIKEDSNVAPIMTTIVNAIIEVLRTNSPLTSSEIYKEIVARGLYIFGAKAPCEVVYKELMRTCENQETFARTSKKKLFKIVGERDSHKLFALIDEVQKKSESDSEETTPVDVSKQRAGGIIDWNNIGDLRGTKPTKVIFKGMPKYNDGEIKVDSWKFVLLTTYKALLDNFPDIDVTQVRYSRSRKKLASFNKKEIDYPYLVDEERGLWMDCNWNADYIVNISKVLFEFCGVSLNNVTIYLHDDGIASETDANFTGREQKILALFKNNFPRGMRLQFVDYMRLRTVYEKEYGEEFKVIDDEIKAFIMNHGFETEPNKFSHIDNLLCGTTVEEIEALIAEQNEIGAKRIWIEPLFNHFRERLGLAVNADLFIQIIMKHGKKRYRKDDGYGFIFYSGISLDGQKEEMRAVVASLLKRENTHLTLTEIQQRLPAYPPLAAKKGLNLAESPYIICSPDGTYSHIDCVYIHESEIAAIKEIIETLISETGRTGREEVITKLKEEMPSIFENNESFGVAGVWKAITARLVDIFIFSNWQIQRKRG